MVATVTQLITATKPVDGWVDQLLIDGSFRPGVDCYRRFAKQLLDRAKAVYDRRQLSPDLKFWIFATGTGKFNLWTAPTASGIDYAQVWQGNQSEPGKPLKETYGGMTLEIDQSVALTVNPSEG